MVVRIDLLASVDMDVLIISRFCDVGFLPFHGYDPGFCYLDWTFLNVVSSVLLSYLRTS